MVIERLLGHQPLETGVLLLQCFESRELIPFQAVVLLLPAVEGLRANPVAAAQAARCLTGRMLVQGADDLLLAEPTPAQGVLLRASCPRGLSLSLD